MSTTVHEFTVEHVTSDGGCGRACDSKACQPTYTVRLQGVEKEIQVSAEVARKILKKMRCPGDRHCCYQRDPFWPRSEPVYLKLVLEE